MSDKRPTTPTPFDPAWIGITPELWQAIQAQLAPGEIVLCGAAWHPKGEDAELHE